MLLSKPMVKAVIAEIASLCHPSRAEANVCVLGGSVSGKVPLRWYSRCLGTATATGLKDLPSAAAQGSLH